MAETGAIAEAAPATGSALVGAPILNAPLPPRRPAELAGGRQTAAARASTPLDLSLFTIRSGP